MQIRTTGQQSPETLNIYAGTASIPELAGQSIERGAQARGGLKQNEELKRSLNITQQNCFDNVLGRGNSRRKVNDTTDGIRLVLGHSVASHCSLFACMDSNATPTCHHLESRRVLVHDTAPHLCNESQNDSTDALGHSLTVCCFTSSY